MRKNGHYYFIISFLCTCIFLWINFTARPSSSLKVLRLFENICYLPPLLVLDSHVFIPRYFFFPFQLFPGVRIQRNYAGVKEIRQGSGLYTAMWKSRTLTSFSSLLPRYLRQQWKNREELFGLGISGVSNWMCPPTILLCAVSELGYRRCRSVVEDNMLSTWWEENREMKGQETRYTLQNHVHSDLLLPTGPCLSKFHNSTTVWELNTSASERHFLYEPNKNQIGKINL